jgi:hypothetical protein
MDMIIAILLWINAMVSNGSYSNAEYDSLVRQHDQVIDQVMLDPIQQQQVWAATGDQVPTVVIGEEE